MLKATSKRYCSFSDLRESARKSKVESCLLPCNWPMLSLGGIIVVDDCKPDNQFDGAMQAYTEFTATHKMPPRFVLDKLGILEKKCSC